MAAMPKSGSTFLISLIANIPSFRKAIFFPSSHKGRWHELCERNITNCGVGNFVSRLHIVGHEYTINMIKKCNLRPFILTRNITDCVVSWLDHVKDQNFLTLDKYITKEKDDDYMYSLFIQTMLQNYFEFYSSWKTSEFKTSMFRYENIYDDLDAMRDAIAHVLPELALSRQQVAFLMDYTRNNSFTRYNVGKAGRGMTLLKEHHLRDIVRLARYYKEFDMSTLGIPAELQEKYA
ncbi:MAG: sulfotransferase domain-containing protein [Deltaproteobacteria bacterium]|nr:sulfotransferase domain-containing protein [Deltaproteobacteria bacterium]